MIDEDTLQAGREERVDSKARAFWILLFRGLCSRVRGFGAFSVPVHFG